jgi:Arc/MetJ-type ribon-helix-helix transcriptional regulator
MTTLTIRLDDRLEEALAFLQASGGGASKSEVARAALLAAEKSARRAALRAESQALAADPADRQEAVKVAGEMAQLNAW